MTILCPADYNETRGAIRAAAEMKGPTYIRIQKEPSPVFTSPQATFEIGRATVLHEGDDVAIFCAGSLAYAALSLARKLTGVGVFVRVVQFGTLKPLDTEVIADTCRRCRAIITAEEHNTIGGLFEAVASALRGRAAIPIEPVGMHDQFGQTGGWHELLDHFGLNEQGMLRAAVAALNDTLFTRKVQSLFNHFETSHSAFEGSIR
jgi:transketolase